MIWLYENNTLESPPKDSYGFIYIITNLLTDRRYLGRKYFTSAHSRQVKGKTKRSRVESDWKDYWGSNKELLKDIKTHGKENFNREIIYIGYSRGECNYMESKLIMMNECLESDDWYNSWMSFKGHGSTLGRLKPKTSLTPESD